jgi:protein-S-isoprenylcysteine O-methyltransferase Ste14
MQASEQLTARLPPPLLYLGLLVVGLVLSALFPTPLLSGGLPVVLGVLLVALGLGVGAWAAVTMRRAGESPNPTEPTRTLVVSGPFRFSRNPLYLALTLLDAGIALAFSSLWALALLVIVLVIMDRRVIASEERYLHGQFGERYAQYTARVRRWL